MATPFPFGSGNVLTAAQMNAITTLPVSTKTASHTLTISDLGTRVVMNSASPTTITVNTSIFGASDKVEILNIGAGVCTVTAGTCTVGTTGSLALAQNAGGTLAFISAGASVFTASGVTATPGGLVCVKAETAFSAVTSFTADSIFTSSYTNYKIIVRHTATTQGDMTMQLRASAVAATTNYNYQRAYFSSTTSSPVRSSSQSSFFVASGSGGDFMQSNWIELTAPQLTASTTFWNNYQQSDLANTTQALSLYAGINSNATAYDGFAISIAGGGTMTGSYTVYGYAKTV